MSNYRNIFFLFALVFFSSCTAIADIFKAGMGVGAIAVIIVIVAIIALVLKMFSGSSK